MNDPIEGTVINMLRCSRISKILSVSEHYVYMDEEKHFCYLNIPKHLTQKQFWFERHAHICYVHTPNNPLCFVFFSCPKSPKLIRIIWRSPHITSYFLTLLNVTHTKTRPPQLMLIFSNQQQKVSMMSMTNLSLKTFNEF